MSEPEIPITLNDLSGPDFFQMAELRESFPDHQRIWKFVAGDYSRHENIFVERPRWAPDYTGIPVDELRGVELIFKRIIEYYLDRNRETGKPVIALDIGAMAATTWIRLGMSFEEEVLNSQLALVATNRTYSPDKDGLNIPYMPEELKGFIRENKELVHYKIADAKSFGNLSITLPNGQSTRLAGHVQFVHEADSLSRYSPTPQRDIELLSRMVSEDGIYFAYGAFPYADHLPESHVIKDQHNVAVLNAHHNLTTNLGFSLVTQVESGARSGQDLVYAVFKRPNAPSIIID